MDGLKEYLMNASLPLKTAYFRICIDLHQRHIYILYTASRVSSVQKINILCVSVIILFAQFMNLENPSNLKQQLSQQYVLALNELPSAMNSDQYSIYKVGMYPKRKTCV